MARFLKTAWVDSKDDEIRFDCVVNLDYVIYARPENVKYTRLDMRGDPDPLIIAMNFETFCRRVYMNQSGDSSDIVSALENIVKVLNRGR